MQRWIHAAGYVLIAVVASGGEFFFGVWDLIFAENQPPQATIKVTPKEGKVPLTVRSRASDSSDPEGRRLTYRWSVNGKAVQASNSTDDPWLYKHTFNEIGTHVIAVQVEDDKGLVDAADETIEVSEKYDAERIVEVSDKTERLLREGDYVTALELVNQFRYSCVHMSIPTKQCAQFHAWAADAQLHLGRYEEGFASISAATEMMPGDVFYMVTQAEYYIVRGQADRAVVELMNLSSQKHIGSRGVLYLGIAHLIAGNRDDARAHLGRVTKSQNQFRPVAEFALIVTESVEGHTATAFTEQGMRPIVCWHEPLRTLFSRKSTVVERHIMVLRGYVERLDVGVQDRLKETMGAMQCS